MSNISSKYFSILSNVPPASWVAHITRDFLICYSYSNFSSIVLWRWRDGGAKRNDGHQIHQRHTANPRAQLQHLKRSSEYRFLQICVGRKSIPHSMKSDWIWYNAVRSWLKIHHRQPLWTVTSTLQKRWVGWLAELQYMQARTLGSVSFLPNRTALILIIVMS